MWLLYIHKLPTSLTMKKLLLGLTLFATFTSAIAAPRSYAILSLAGDTISTMTFVPETGSKINQSDKQTYELKNTVFDEAAIRAASAAVKKIEPDAAPFLMLTLDADLYKAQNAMFDDPAANQANRDYLKTLWKDHPVTHLILVTKFRTDAEVKYMDATEGSGKIEGLGFYMDNRANVTTFGKAQNYSSKGILMPYAYVKLRLIDASTLQVVREVTQKQSQIVTYKPDADRAVRTWDALTPKQKTDYLDGLVRAAVAEAMPKLLAD